MRKAEFLQLLLVGLLLLVQQILLVLILRLLLILILVIFHCSAMIFILGNHIWCIIHGHVWHFRYQSNTIPFSLLNVFLLFHIYDDHCIFRICLNVAITILYSLQLLLLLFLLLFANYLFLDVTDFTFLNVFLLCILIFVNIYYWLDCVIDSCG